MIDGKTVSTTDAPNDQHIQLRAELDAIRSQIQRLPQYDPSRRDLIHMSDQVEIIWRRLDNEMILCRRWRRATANYLEMVERIEEQLKIMKREVFWRQMH